MDLVEAQHGAGHHGPEVLGHVLDEGAEELGVLCVPATCHVQDGPEEHGLCVVAVIGFFFAKDGEKGVKVLEISNVCLVRCLFYDWQQER